MDRSAKSATRETVDYRRTAHPLAGNRSGATCFACGSARVCCAVMVGTLGGEASSFIACDRCQEPTLGRLSEWVAVDPQLRWLTMGIARRFAAEAVS